jgi:hypothetical protein
MRQIRSGRKVILTNETEKKEFKNIDEVCKFLKVSRYRLMKEHRKQKKIEGYNIQILQKNEESEEDLVKRLLSSHKKIKETNN